MKDYYHILGVDRNATDADIKKAYRRLAMQHHPDRNPGDKAAEEKFKEINEAYSCLCDAEKRANYERFGTSEGFGAEYGPFPSGFGDIFEDIFGDFFSAFTGRQRLRPAKGPDLRYDLEIDLRETVFGAEKIIDIPRYENCAGCGGSGSMPGKGPVTCTACKGTGQIRMQHGFFSVSRTCGRCGGTGRIITDPCRECSGTGKVRRLRKVSVKIPPGVDTGNRLKLSGEGEAGSHGGPNGDLYVIITVKPHPFFHREGIDLVCEVPISFPHAALGTEIDVPTIDGVSKLSIPPGTPSGKLFHIKGKGIPRLGARGRGDQIVKVYVDVPKKLTPRQRELLEEFASISGDGLSKGFMDRLKDLFGKEDAVHKKG